MVVQGHTEPFAIQALTLFYTILLKPFQLMSSRHKMPFFISLKEVMKGSDAQPRN